MNEAILHTDGKLYQLRADLLESGWSLRAIEERGRVDSFVEMGYLVQVSKAVNLRTDTVGVMKHRVECPVDFGATADDRVRADWTPPNTQPSPSDAKHREQCKVDFSQIENFAHHPKHVPSVITQKLIDQLLERDAHGKAKYGATLDRNDLTLADWLQHMAEELMDGAGYALAAKRELLRLASVDKAAYDLVKAMNALDPVGQLRAMQVLKDIVMSANGT